MIFSFLQGKTCAPEKLGEFQGENWYRARNLCRPVLYFINLPLRLEILGNMCILMICFLVYDVTNFGINLSFLIKLFSYMTKKSQDKNLNILSTKKAFKEKKSIVYP